MCTVQNEENGKERKGAILLIKQKRNTSEIHLFFSLARLIRPACVDIIFWPKVVIQREKNQRKQSKNVKILPYRPTCWDKDPELFVD
jgi:hypothetical protein